MSTWIEMRCEGTGLIDTDGLCWSDSNKGPADSAEDSNESILLVMKSLRDEAKKLGWKRNKQGWFCPCCASKIPGK